MFSASTKMTLITPSSVLKEHDMTGSKSNPTALVTGGARGIGLGISTHLAAGGYDLVLCGVRDESAVADTVEQLRSHGTGIHYCQADISKSDDRQQLLEFTRERAGQLNLLVNNAGVAPNVRADILQADEESFDRLIAINLKGPYFLTQLCANYMIEQKSADPGHTSSIINVSSISATVASVTRGDYCISKAGVSMATQLWAARLGEYSIPVYEIRPGIIKTDMTAVVTEKYDALIAEGLLVESRWGTPEDVGRAVVALATGAMPYATGNVINIDGGLTVRRL